MTRHRLFFTCEVVVESERLRDWTGGKSVADTECVQQAMDEMRATLAKVGDEIEVAFDDIEAV